MLFRLVILVALVLVGWYLFRKLTAPSQKPADNTRSRGDYQPMVACQRCGVHVPADQALNRGDASYCCRDHLPDDR